MRTFVAFLSLCLPNIVHGQTENLASLRARCIPGAPESTLRAVVKVESGGNPNAMQIDFPHALLNRWHLAPGSLMLKSQPKDRPEALQWLAYLDRFHIFVDLGLMQVSTEEATRRGIAPDSLLDPCTNLRVGWQILEDAYNAEVKVYGPGQTALSHAISRYNTGSPQSGIDNGYVARVLAAAESLTSNDAFTIKKGSK